MSRRPGGELASRPLHLIWICDCSSSMHGEKIRALNSAIRSAIPAVRVAADANPNAEVLVRAVSFSLGARWHIAQPTPVRQLEWTDLEAPEHDAPTDLGAALALVAEQLKVPPMSARALPPVLVLVSDGVPTGGYATGLRRLLDEPWGKRAVRIAVAIGGDADLECLRRFIDDPDQAPLRANHVSELVNRIRWASTVALHTPGLPEPDPDDDWLYELPTETRPAGGDIW